MEEDSQEEEAFQEVGKMIKLTNLLGDNFVSLYEKEHIMFLVVHRSDFEVLELIRDNTKNMQVLVFTIDEIHEGKDVFPLEFLNMKNEFVLVQGDDLLDDLELHKVDVRKQLEYELRSKLINLRTEFVFLKNKKELYGLVQNIVPVLKPICYGLLFLKDEEPKGDIFGQLGKLYDPKIKILKKLAGIEKKPKEEEMHNLVKDTKDFLVAYAQIVDKFKIKG